MENVSIERGQGMEAIAYVMLRIMSVVDRKRSRNRPHEAVMEERRLMSEEERKRR